jgi:hypothetical protein
MLALPCATWVNWTPTTTAASSTIALMNRMTRPPQVRSYFVARRYRSGAAGSRRHAARSVLGVRRASQNSRGGLFIRQTCGSRK